MAFDAFLYVDGVPGESTDDNHGEWIEILSYSHGVAQQGGGARSNAGASNPGRTDHQNFSIVKALDKSSPKLNLFCCNGAHIPEVKIELCRAVGDKQKYMEYKMTDVTVATVRPGGSSNGGESLPLEEVAFNYGKMEWTYTETDHNSGQPKGDVQTHWDVTKNSGG